MSQKNSEYKEIQLPKGAAEAIFGGLNDNFVPKKNPNSRPNANGTKKKTGRKTK